MVPFQLDIIRSSPSVKPYEQASVNLEISWSTLRSHVRIAGSLTSTESLLAFLELFQETEVTGNLSSHACGYQLFATSKSEAEGPVEDEADR